jgi:dienelactone hydrolase
MAREIVAGLRAAGRRATLLAYPEAGHAAFGPPASPGTPPPPAEAMAMMGGTAEATDAARADAWPRVLDALDAALKPA